MMFDWFKPIWDFLHIKALVPVFLIVAFSVQIYSGYFRFLSAYFKSIQWNGSRIIISSALATTVFMLTLLLDPQAASAARNAAGKSAELIWNYGGEMGKSIWILLALAYFISFRNSTLRALIFGATIGTALTGLSTTILKWIVLRARPSTGLGHASFFNFNYFGTDDRSYQSFPSGDVSIVAGACFFLAFVFHKKPWVVFFLLTPLATSFARMHWERHWFSDTVAAMILGVFWASLIWGYEKYRLTGKKNS